MCLIRVYDMIFIAIFFLKRGGQDLKKSAVCIYQRGFELGTLQYVLKRKALISCSPAVSAFFLVVFLSVTFSPLSFHTGKLNKETKMLLQI